MISVLKKISLVYYILFPNIFGIGYNQYKYSIIKKIINYGNKSVKLNNYLDERMVELPWVINKLKKSKNKKILDVGCTLNFKYLIDFFLKDNEIYFLNLYKEKNNFFSNQISYIQNDIRTPFFKDNYFDYVTAISVIEHIGFDNSSYNFQKNKSNLNKLNNKRKSYKKAIIEIKRILKKNGKLFLTLPFGKKEIFKNYMQFDEHEVKKIINIFKPSKYSIQYYKFDKIKKEWKKITANKCKHVEAISKKNVGISSMSVALIEIEK